MARNYSRSLVMFKPAPGKAGLELVPDMADRPRQVLRRRQDLDLHDPGGPEVRGRHPDHHQGDRLRRLAHLRPRLLKRARSTSTTLLNWPKDYKGPYKGPKDADISSAIETPDDSTIVFHLKQPFAEFDYLAAAARRRHRCRRPRTPARSTRRTRSPRARTCGRATPTSTRGGTLVRNPNWDAATDPNRKALPDQIDVKLGLQADDLDNQIIAGDQDVDIAGTGVQPAALPKVLQQKEPPGPGGQPGRRAPVVQRRSSRREAARQHRLPQGRHVRDEPVVLPERLRRRVRRRRHRDDAAPPIDPRLQGLRPLRPEGRTRTGRRTRPRSRWRSAASRTVSRPTSATAPSVQGEGRRRGVPAVAGQGRHQGQHQADARRQLHLGDLWQAVVQRGGQQRGPVRLRLGC